MDSSNLPRPLVPFKPPFWCRHPMLQTVIASQKFRKSGGSAMEDLATPIIFDCGDGIRLKGSYSRHPNSQGIFIFLHGWEGSENSTYVVSSSRYLYNLGYSIFRLNFRDHGDTHHLNETIFHAVRLSENYQAVRQAAKLEAGPSYIVGFSLGGNFALRLSRQLADYPIPNLEHVFSISPVIDPWEASPLIDKNPLIRQYFFKKWTTSLRKKEAAFPDLYDFAELLECKFIMDITDKFLPKYTEFEDKQTYFTSYAINPADLTDCKVDISIIMAKDDPIVPYSSLNELELSPRVKKIICDYGGHNGFFKTLRGPTWYDLSLIHI